MCVLIMLRGHQWDLFLFLDSTSAVVISFELTAFLEIHLFKDGFFKEMNDQLQ